MKKRQFLKKLGQAAVLSPLLPYTLKAAAEPRHLMYDPENEDGFWEKIRQDYDLKQAYINLENGYYCISPRPVMERFMEHVKNINYEGAYYMRTAQEQNKKLLSDSLAAFLGCREGELVITRNTTESLDLVIGGYPWKSGDEAIMAEQDYGAMLNQFRMVSGRYGVVNKVISIPNHPQSDNEIVDLYESMITRRTRLIMVCHMVNITGQILPVKKICDMAHCHGVEVMVDGAHCVGHIAVNIPELNCDYYGSSLHKWLSAPLGCGILYIAPGRAARLWPLFASHEENPDKLARLNHTGTHPVHTDLAISSALKYHNQIGTKRKEERLRFLQRYWSDKLRTVKGIQLNTPTEPFRSCGIGNAGIPKMEPELLAKALLEEFGIFTVAINSAHVKGCRITPNVFTTTAELDHFVHAMKTLAQR